MPIPWSGCWIWTGGFHGTRPIITDDAPKQKTRTAHRVSYELFKGEIPRGMCVCHTCDVPACVNPNHLWLGTQQENTADRSNKGRTARNFGEKCGHAKLTWSDIAEIRNDARPAIEIARSYGVSQATISNILNGKRWPSAGYVRTHKPGNEKLTEGQVTAIRADHRVGRVIANEFGVSQGLVSLIKRGKLHK